MIIISICTYTPLFNYVIRFAVATNTIRILEKARKLCMVSRALNIPVEIESSIEVI